MKTELTIAAAALALLAGPAFAADAGTGAQDGVGPWQVRVRALGIMTENDGSVHQVPGADLSYSDTVTPELDFSYYVTPEVSAELILGASYAKVFGDGSAAGLGRVGKAWFLPPTLTLQYHVPGLGAFQPYVGAGVNYTMFFDTSNGSLQDFDIDNDFGWVAQAGADFMIDAHWGLNLDVKKLSLEPDWSARLGDGTRVDGKAKLNPLLVGTGVTYRF